MPIPKHDEMWIPALELLSKTGQLKLQEFEEPLARHFSLSEEELHQEYDSGNAKIFYDRISWALSYLYMAGLLSKPKRGVYEINASGSAKLQTPHEVASYVNAEVAKKQKKYRKDKESSELQNAESLTPQEELYTSAEKIREARYREVIDIIISKTPREFERLVVTLLQKMGYGGEIKQAGEVTPYTNDGGIDGIIKEDVLGLGRIHLQAKRYSPQNTVGREEIQKFVGALAVAQSNKGVFITTSSFSNGALTYADSLNGATTLILIDGSQLAEYLYDYGVGFQVEQTIEIKRLDSEFWDSQESDKKPVL